MTKLSPGQEYLTPFHRCAERGGEGGIRGDRNSASLCIFRTVQGPQTPLLARYPLSPPPPLRSLAPPKAKFSSFSSPFVRPSARACPCVSRRRINPRLPLRFNSIVERDNRSSRWRNDSRGSIDRFRAWKKRGRETTTFESEWWNSRAIRMWKFNSEKAVKRCYYYA